MVEYKELIILSRHAPNKGVSESFGNGLNLISLEKEYEFNFLKLKNQSSDGGSFIVNGITFFPEEDKEHSLLYLAINSKVFCLALTLVAESKDKKTTIEALQNELVTLRDMPLNNDEEKMAKINAILDTIKKYPLGYVLVDQNEDVNYDNNKLITDALEAHREDTTFILLEKEVDEDDEKEKKVEEKIKTPKVKKERVHHSNVILDIFSEIGDFVTSLFTKPTWFYVGRVISDNVLLFFLTLLEAAFVVFLAHLAPYYFVIDSAVWGVLLIIVLVICFVIFVLYLSASLSFLEKDRPDNRTRIALTITFTELFTLLGIGLAYGIFFAFAYNNVIVKMEKYTFDLMVLAIVFSCILGVLPFFSYPIHLLVKKIKKLFKK